MSEAAKSASYVQSAAGTKGLIIDIRNYPSEFVVFTLGQLLVAQPTDFVRFTVGDVMNPGAFHWVPVLGSTAEDLDLVRRGLARRSRLRAISGQS